MELTHRVVLSFCPQSVIQSVSLRSFLAACRISKEPPCCLTAVVDIIEFELCQSLGANVVASLVRYVPVGLLPV